ncbi:MAG: prephenate dehydrogenase, partial [Candidatus Omnitrophica bacterium]|nr:prephenate dehydrogenase [Candidatus Omnitrophota bacterium]
MADFKKIGIIGIGLIGGSICIDIKKRNIAEKVIGYSRKMETMKKAIERRIIDEFYEKPEDVINYVDFLILSTPISVLEEYIRLINKVKCDIYFTDVASVKEVVCKKVEEIIGKKANFVGSHPITGSEKSGIDFIKEGLFENKVVVITPTKNTKENIKGKIENFWKKLGSKVIKMSPKKHDEVFGFTSH